MFELSNPLEQINNLTLNKYKTAGLIATKTVNKIMDGCKPDIKLCDLVKTGEEFVKDEVSKIYKDVSYKGLCFPICLSQNNVAGYYSATDADVLKGGDLLKIELGVHIDGYPSIICFSTLVSNGDEKYNQKQVDVMNAVIKASKEVVSVMKPGKTNLEVVKVLEKYAEKYNCNIPLYNNVINEYAPGIISYQMSRYVNDGYNDDYDEFIHQFILNRENKTYDFTMQEIEFEEDEVYAVDITMCSGSGKLGQVFDTNIYKRNKELKNLLKLKASRETLNLFNNECFPIKINKDSKIKLGLRECLEKRLLNKYSVVGEKDGEYVARIVFTVLVKKSPILICGKSGDDELKKIS